MAKQYRRAGEPEEKIKSLLRELEPVKLERGTEYLIGVFDALNAARSYGMSGPLPISYLEVKAYAELMGECFEKWEVEALRQMDAAFIEESYKLQGSKQ